MPSSRITGAKLDHIAFGLPSLADAPDTLVGLLGGRPLEGGPNPDFIGCQWEFARGARIECIAPNDSPTSFMKRFVETRGSGVHHMTFKVPDIYAARDEAEALGYIVTGFSDRYEAWKELFLHPKSAHGIVIQMAQTNPDLPDDSWSRDFDFPPYEGSNQVPSEPADLLGIRLVVERPEHAERLFGELLGGGATIDGQRTIYRWHESPLWVAVVVDSATEEGPQAIEVRAASCSRLSEVGIAAMGGRFEPA
jgi:methylmalonyl-CoA/ethylmalonyl-CoA epimerase